jgi:hypothetical protein
VVGFEGAGMNRAARRAQSTELKGALKRAMREANEAWAAYGCAHCGDNDGTGTLAIERNVPTQMLVIKKLCGPCLAKTMVENLDATLYGPVH